MFEQAGVSADEASTYLINFVIAPRINAMGRLEHGMDSLRLLCTKKRDKGYELSKILAETNKNRQELTDSLLKIALDVVGEPRTKLLVVEHEEFHEGVIGLVAGKLVETYYRPTIVIERGEKISKASARSISGVNIIDLIRQNEDLLINAGGHPMAAGFTIETKNLDMFRKAILKSAEDLITDNMLESELNVDCELILEDIDWKLYKKLAEMEPFGIGNPKPTFVLRKIDLLDKLAIGKDKNHLKLVLPSKVKNQTIIPALWFGKGKALGSLGSNVSLAFTLDENTWNGKTELQLRIKDIK
jgi:single-stranded-DNA-specific exonuclease